MAYWSWKNSDIFEFFLSNCARLIENTNRTKTRVSWPRYSQHLKTQMIALDLDDSRISSRCSRCRGNSKRLYSFQKNTIHSMSRKKKGARGVVLRNSSLFILKIWIINTQTCIKRNSLEGNRNHPNLRRSGGFITWFCPLTRTSTKNVNCSDLFIYYNSWQVKNIHKKRKVKRSNVQTKIINK